MSVIDAKFDLITGSVGRIERLARLAESLELQSHKSFHWTIAEQADVHGVRQALSALDLASSWSTMESARGLSRARNAALAVTSAPLVAFPDDDCWYPPKLLEEVNALFLSEPGLAFVVGEQVTDSGNKVLKTPLTPQAVTRENVWRLSMSSALFFRREWLESVGGFHPDLGVGSGTSLGSGEETDVILKVMSAGGEGLYDPRFKIHHPDPSETPGRMAPSLGLTYGIGMGFVMGSHSFGFAAVATSVVRPLLGSIIALARRDPPLAKFRFAVAAGRLMGWSKSIGRK